MTDVKMTVAARSDVGRARDNNEDAFTITDLATGARLETGPGVAAIPVRDKGVLLAVSDGMGGHEAGEVASALVLDSLRTAIDSAGGDSIEEKIEAAVRRANEEVAVAARATDKRGMGATLTAVFAQASDAYVAEVGDSRAYLLRAGRLRQITRDQSLVQMLVEGGVLTAEEAKVSPHRHVILQAMGLADNVRVAIGRLHLRRGDMILVCSDGVTNAISDEELRDILLGALRPEDACNELIDLANERGGEDNLTAIVAQFDGDGLTLPPRDESVTSTFRVLREFTDEPGSGSSPPPPDEADEPDEPPPSAVPTGPPAPPVVEAARGDVTEQRWLLVFVVAAALIVIGVYLLARYAGI